MNKKLIIFTTILILLPIASAITANVTVLPANVTHRHGGSSSGSDSSYIIHKNNTTTEQVLIPEIITELLPEISQTPNPIITEIIPENTSYIREIIDTGKTFGISNSIISVIIFGLLGVIFIIIIMIVIYYIIKRRNK